MTNFAIIDNNVIINVVVADLSLVTPDPSWTDLATLPEGAWIGWTFDGTNWNAPSE